MILLPELATPATATVVVVLVQQPGENDKPGEEEFGKSSPLGLVVLLLFLVAVVLLVRSMTKHLKRVPESFEEPEPDDADDDSVDDRGSSDGAGRGSADGEDSRSADGEDSRSGQ